MLETEALVAEVVDTGTVVVVCPVGVVPAGGWMPPVAVLVDLEVGMGRTGIVVVPGWPVMPAGTTVRPPTVGSPVVELPRALSTDNSAAVDKLVAAAVKAPKKPSALVTSTDLALAM